MKYFFLFIAFSSYLKAESQTIVRETLSNAGDIYKNAQAGELSWTLGEVSVESYFSDTLKLTQGFQQVYLKIVPVYNLDNYALKIYPNPANTYVILENDDPSVVKYQLTDALGKVLSIDNFKDKSAYLDIEQLASGIYFITFYDKTNVAVYVSKIIKSTN